MAKKKSNSSKAGSKKGSKKKGAAGKKKAAGKSTAKKTTKATAVASAKKAVKAAAKAGATGMCLSLTTSDQIVEDAVRRAAPGISVIDFEETLEDHSIFTEGQRTVFRQDVFNRILARGCDINMGEIPNDANSVLRDISSTIKARAR